MVKEIKIGVLALQGDFKAHGDAISRALESNNTRVSYIKKASELEDLDALILPGGESSAMLKLLTDDFLTEIQALHDRGKIIFGSCAGAILLAKTVSNPEQNSLALIDIDIIRNAYGRQLDSFITEDVSANLNSPYFDILNQKSEAIFIRAPKISRTGASVETLLSYKDEPVLVKEGNILVSTFHPELATNPHPVYKIITELLSN